MRVKDGARHKVGDNLVDRGGVQVGGLFHQYQAPDHCPCGTDPAEAQPGGQGFRERAAVDDAAVLDAALGGDVQGQQRRHRVAVIAQHLIGGVLDHGDIKIIGQPQRRLARSEGQCLASGVGEIGGEAGVFHPASCGLCLDEDLGCGPVAQRVQPIAGRLISVERAQRAQIGGPGHQHGIAGSDHQLAQIVQGLLAARGDQDIAGITGDGQLGHFDRDPLAQGQMALRDGILQGLGGRAIRQCCGKGVATGVGGEQRWVGDATGEGQDIGLVQQLQQLADFRGFHPAGPAGQDLLPFHAVPLRSGQNAAGPGLSQQL